MSSMQAEVCCLQRRRNNGKKSGRRSYPVLSSELDGGENELIESQATR